MISVPLVTYTGRVKSLVTPTMLLGTRPILSRHAMERMRERRVGLEEVLEALENPIQILYDEWNDVYIAVSPTGVAVVYAYRGPITEIVTVMTRKEYEALVSKYGRKRYRVIA